MVKLRKEQIQSRNKSMHIQKSEPVEMVDGDKKAKDDWILLQKVQAFQDYQYWKLPEQYSIEDLLKDQ